MKKFIISLILISLILIFPLLVLGKVGVGVGTGKIEIDQDLKPGKTYNLPPITVINTGDEPGEYAISIDYKENIPELKPNKEWFTFNPSIFYLQPGQSQTVQLKLDLPIKGVEPGNYFAFLTAMPVKESETGAATIGVAAATKLYFNVAPSNIFSGIYYRVLSFLDLYSPWSYVLLGLIIAIIFVLLFRKFFSFNIGISLKKKEDNADNIS
jgi:hypothetical protein